MICLPLIISLIFLLKSQHHNGFGGVFWAVCFPTLRAVVSRIWQSFRRLRPLKSGLDIPTNLRKDWEKSRMWQAQINFHDQSTKVKLLILKLHHLCILHGSEVTPFRKMPITRLRSNVIGVAQLCARYMKTANDVKFHVHTGTSGRKIYTTLKALERPENGFKIWSTTNDRSGIFSRTFWNNGRNRIRTRWKTRCALASSQIKVTVLPIVTGFVYRLRTQTMVRSKAYERLFLSLGFLTPGTIVNDVISAASSIHYPRFFGHFWSSVWPCSCSIFDLKISPANSLKKGLQDQRWVFWMQFFFKLRPTGGVNHPDSVLVKVGKLPAKKALQWLDGSILSNSRKF